MGAAHDHGREQLQREQGRRRRRGDAEHNATGGAGRRAGRAIASSAASRASDGTPSERGQFGVAADGHRVEPERRRAQPAVQPSKAERAQHRGGDEMDGRA